MKPLKIVLIGFMGCGKSSVAPLLAERLSLPLLEVDRIVIERSDYEHIPAIFEARGETGFRELEAAAALSLRDTHNAVISTGGGIIGRQENIDNLRHRGGIVVFLRTTFDEVTRRIKDFEDRPLFRDKKRAEELFGKRLPIYAQHADIIIDTDGKNPNDVCSEILAKLEALQ